MQQIESDADLAEYRCQMAMAAIPVVVDRSRLAVVPVATALSVMERAMRSLFLPIAQLQELAESNAAAFSDAAAMFPQVGRAPVSAQGLATRPMSPAQTSNSQPVIPDVEGTPPLNNKDQAAILQELMFTFLDYRAAGLAQVVVTTERVNALHAAINALMEGPSSSDALIQEAQKNDHARLVEPQPRSCGADHRGDDRGGDPREN